MTGFITYKLSAGELFVTHIHYTMIYIYQFTLLLIMQKAVLHYLSSTPNSLFLSHILITDVRQITGRNKQQWISCSSGRDMTGVNIYSAVDNTIIAGRVNTTTMGPGKYSYNGIYYCLATGQANYVSLLLSMRSSNWPTYGTCFSSLYTNYVVSEATNTMAVLLRM